MATSEYLPDVITKIHRSLYPYIKQRQEVTHIRQVLAIHLGSYVNSNLGIPTSGQLSLADATWDANSTLGSSSTLRGSHKEYLTCVRAHIKALKDYEELRNEHRANPGNVNQRTKAKGRGPLSGSDGYNTITLDLFSELVRQRRQHDRLSITQDYVDMLAQKPAAAANYLHPDNALRRTAHPPKIPVEVMTIGGSSRDSGSVDLKELVDKLERTVLRAKLWLKREQKLLAKIKAGAQRADRLTSNDNNHLQALGLTRNELITWIEEELGKAGESPATSDHSQTVQCAGHSEKDFVEHELGLIQCQYSRYTKAREALISSATGRLDSTPVIDVETELGPENEVVDSKNPNHALHPYLERLMALAAEQKSMIQQKSHLTIALAKQLKDANQGLERLADESHLLPTYRMPSKTPQQKGLESPISFGQGLADHEKPDSSHRARAWAFSAESARVEVKDTILSKLEEGESTLADARNAVSELRQLLGMAPGQANESDAVSDVDLWAVLDGNLGIIKDHTQSG